jgi:hypothetical protein
VLGLASSLRAQAPNKPARFRDPANITGDPTGLRLIPPIGVRMPYPEAERAAEHTAFPVVAFVVDTTGRVEPATISSAGRTAMTSRESRLSRRSHSHDQQRMRRFHFALPLALAVAFSGPALAQDTSATHRAAVKQLLEVTHLREVTERSMDAIMKSQMEQMPQLAPYANVLQAFYKEQMDWTALEPEYTRIYLEVFTEKELRDMAALYQTPLGKMMLAKTPVVLAKSNDFATRRLQAAMPQLMQKLQAAMQETPPTPAPADH